MKREKIDLLKKLISSESKKFISENTSLTRSFFDDQKLKERIRKSFLAMELHFDDWGTTSDADFNDFFNIALKEFKSTNPITVTESISLKKSKTTWLTSDRQLKIGWGDEDLFNTYRDRYFEYLKRNGRSKNYIIENRKSSLSIIEKLADPYSEQEVLVKGLVVGSVQSGKTANFNGVINSAIDLGYRLIIVLSGITEDLREQTQKRIENDVIGDLIGLKGGSEIWRGVGAVTAFKVENKDVVVTSITSRSSDFTSKSFEDSFSLNSYNILVCKKNVSVLKNILISLSEKKGAQRDIPFLIIDDEADNASLNNMGYKGKDYATKINMQIRSLLNMFSKRSYLGYTATPFANILQDRNEQSDKVYNTSKSGKTYQFNMIPNLFPDDFIELLYPPSNYIGIKQFFDTKQSNVIKIDSLIADPINDYLNSFPPRFVKETGFPTFSKEKGTRSAKQDDDYPKVLPDSLKDAIKCFILTIAVRLSRKPEMANSELYQPHHSMLIHISRFGIWQNTTKNKILEFLNGSDSEVGILTQINNAKKGADILLEFERIWDKYYFYIMNNIKNLLPAGYEDDFITYRDFNKDVIRLLPEAIKNIEVKAINSITNDKLHYPDKNDNNFSEKKYIAIGGNRLSRGFTLEGLTINYFIRGTENADTLMQMGRWFGYRPGYLDCCKLFTTYDSIEKFNETSLIIEDLELKFEQLSRLPDRSPKDFTLWIRNNPDVIKLTRGNFLKNLKTLSLVFSDTVQQSTQFLLKKAMLIRSFDEFKNKVNNIAWENKEGYYVYNTDQDGLLEFIDLPNVMNNLNILGLRGFLDSCKKTKKLNKWVIAIKKIKTGEGQILLSKDSGLKFDINLITRRGPKEKETSRKSLLEHNIFKARNSTIITPSDFSITLTEEEKSIVENSFRIDKKNEFIKKGISELDANDKAKEISIPDYVYRSAMDDSTGILIIYLMDLQKVFEVKDGVIDDELQLYRKENGFEDLNCPLIGYALGFPTVKDVDGDEYTTQHVFDKSLNDMTIEELKNFAAINDLDIDFGLVWDQASLLKNIEELLEENEDSEEFDDTTLTL
jgi:hypothetical protein